MPLRHIAVFAVLLASVASAADAPHRRLSAVPFTDVKVQDEFWSARIQTNRERSLPHNFKWCEQTGRISNFAKAAGLMPGKFEGIYFNDSDVYKVLEGAAYSLADRPDPALEKTVDDVIAKIAAAQQKDGYLNCYYTLVEPGRRWTNVPQTHELYCSGHLIEAAVAHWRATGKRTFLDVAVKLADHIDKTFGPGRKTDVPGHEEIELALVKLYQATGEERYLKLANFFIDYRGDATRRKVTGPYAQDHEPVRKASEIGGHAVRAMYFYSGVADVAALSGDQELIDAMGRLWQDVALRKMYITGGIGARHAGEAFGNAYELPNASSYCETCANIGLALWAHRLNLMHADARYADVLERVIYNGVLSGIALDGEHFFYVNPLASSGGHHRQPFYGCACCPTNVVRFIPSVPGYVYAVSNDEKVPALYVNLFVAGTAKVSVGRVKATVTQETRYPWEGKVKLALAPEKPAAFDVCVRIPSWCAHATVKAETPGTGSFFGPVRDNPGTRPTAEKCACPLQADGYFRIQPSRPWRAGDVIDIDLPMEIQRIEAHPSVKDDAGRVAVQRGPIVYCFEAADNEVPPSRLILPHDPKFTAEYCKDLLGGVTVVRGVDRDGHAIQAVPYYAWDHRKPGAMAVWVRQDGKPKTADADDPAWKGLLYRPLEPAKLGPSQPLSFNELTQASASHCHAADAVEALNDGIEPRNSNDHDIPRFTWWDHRGTKEWVQYDFPAARKVSAVAVYWFDDAPRHGQCRVPQSWRLLYKAGDRWQPVVGSAVPGTETNKYNRTEFAPVETTGLRIEVQLQPKFSGGVLEWKWE
jgi:DUF1680 family protein